MPMNLKKKLTAVLAAVLALIALPVGALAAFSSTLLANPTQRGDPEPVRGTH